MLVLDRLNELMEAEAPAADADDLHARTLKQMKRRKKRREMVEHAR